MKDEPPQPAILVVDDDRLLRRMVVETLRDDGLAAVGAEGADEALALLRARPGFALLVTDVNMPGVDGLRLLELAREASAGLKLMVVSGRPHLHAARTPAGTTFLAKPFTARRIVADVRRALGDGAGTADAAER